jgi:DNA gyrase/topoisomerase IV subunit A
MIHPDDVAAWIAQVRQQPEAAPAIIEALAKRLVELDKQNEALRDELVRQSRSPTPVSDEGRVAELTRRVQKLERELRAPGEVFLSLMVFSLDGRAARLALPNADAWRARENSTLAASHLRPRHLTISAAEDDLLLFTNKGRAMRVDVASIEPEEAPANYLSLIPDVRFDLDESLSIVLPLPSAFGQLTLISRKGYARSFRRAEVDSLLERRLPLHSSPVPGDYPAHALLSDGDGSLLVATRAGKGVRFPERAIGVQSAPAIKLDRGDVIVGAAVVSDETTLLLVGGDGVAARREMVGFGAHSTAGNRGKILTRIENVAAVAPVGPNDELWLLTAEGRMELMLAGQVPSGPGASNGKRMLNLGEDRVVAMART